MKRPLIFGALLCALGMMVGCSSYMMTTLVGCEYDEKKDVTDYYVYPLGQVYIPGKWEKCGYNRVARQQFFINPDGVIISVSFPRPERFEWNRDGALRGFDFIKAYYEWERDYFDSLGFECSVIEKDIEKRYLIHRFCRGSGSEKEYDTYFLVRMKGDDQYSVFSIAHPVKWSDEETVLFLKKLFLSE